MTGQPKISDEMKRMEEEYEPLVPAEKKLIAISLIAGSILLILLILISYTLFPAGH